MHYQYPFIIHRLIMLFPQASKNLVYMLIGSAIILALSLGIRHGFGLYLVPISQEFNWGHNVFSLAIAIQNLIWGMAQPFSGALADKYGTKKVVLTGGVLYTLGLLIMALSSSQLLLNMSIGLIMGLALSGTSFAILLSAVGKAAPKEKRSLAMGIASAAGSFGQFVMLPATLFFIQQYGWSSALIISAILSALIIPLAFMLKTPEANVTQPISTDKKLPCKEVLIIAKNYKPFWLLSIGFFVCGFQVVFIGIHMPGYLADHGFDPKMSTIFLALVGLFNVFGTYTAGWLGDKFSKPHLLMGIYGLRGIAMILFLTLPLTNFSIYIFGIVMGLLWLSTVPLTNGIVASMFGIKYLTTLVGFVFLAHQIGSFFGGWLGGLNHQLTGNYHYVWGLSILLSVVGVVVHLFITEKNIIND